MRTIHVLLLALFLTLGCCEQDDYYSEGKRRGSQGIPVEACPYGERHDSSKRARWMRGWSDGRVEYEGEKAKKIKPVE